MAGETTMTIIGNLTDDPTSRFFDSGSFVTNFTVASTPRKLNRATGEWEDGDALFLRCNAWGQLGENIVNSLRKGHRVMVQGRLQQRSYTAKDDEKRTVLELNVDEIGPTLRYATAEVTKSTKPTQAKVEPEPGHQHPHRPGRGPVDRGRRTRPGRRDRRRRVQRRAAVLMRPGGRPDLPRRPDTTPKAGASLTAGPGLSHATPPPAEATMPITPNNRSSTEPDATMTNRAARKRRLRALAQKSPFGVARIALRSES